jgi:hypothetical protein
MDANPPPDETVRATPRYAAPAEVALRAMEARLARLEAQLAFVDLLLAPRIRAAAAAAATHLVLRSDQLPTAAAGFFAVECTAKGVPFRWTEYDEGGRMFVPLVAGVRYMGLLTLLRSPHVSGPADVVLRIGDCLVALDESTSDRMLSMPFEHVADTSGMVEVAVTSTTLFVPAQTIPGSNDQRRLGVQMCSLELMCAGIGSDAGDAAAPADPFAALNTPDAEPAHSPPEAQAKEDELAATLECGAARLLPALTRVSPDDAGPNADPAAANGVALVERRFENGALAPAESAPAPLH